MALISIILPYFNRFDLVHQRLMELYKYAPENCEICLINDASTELDCETQAAWWQKKAARHVIRYKKNPENLGFGGSHNVGAKIAKGEILVFLSDDVIISGNFITSIEVILSGKPDAIVAGEVMYYDTGWNTLQINGKKSIVPYPNGWLIACRRETWEKIGGFDPLYGKFDYEDIDIGATALYYDIELVPLNLPHMLKHLFGQTIAKYYSNREELTKQNRKKFEDKWTKKLEEKFG